MKLILIIATGLTLSACTMAGAARCFPDPITGEGCQSASKHDDTRQNTERAAPTPPAPSTP